MTQRYDADERGCFGDSTVSAGAAGSCPRRWSPRSTSSPPPGRTRWPTRRSSPSSTRSCASTPASRARSTTPSGSASRSAPGSCSSARTSTTPAPTRSATCSARRCSPGGWARPRVIAETGAGQHGVASATAAAYFGLDCTVYMGSVDTRRQALNVARMHLLGAKVVPVDSGSATLKDAINEALRDWVASVDHTAYLFGTAAGPHPFPSMVRDFTRGIGDEARAAVPRAVRPAARRDRRLRRRRLQRDRAVHRRSSTTRTSRSTASSPAATGVDTGRHAATIHAGDSGVLHGARTYVLQDEDGQTIESHSISAGLDYPGVGPQHAHLAKTGRADLPARHRRRGDGRARAAQPHRGDHPRHRVGARRRRRLDVAERARPPRRARCHVLINLCGRGDKDMEHRDRVVRPRRPDGTEEPATPSDACRDRLRDARASRGPRRAGRLPARPASPTSTGGIEALRAMVDAGCDVIEVGLPYSDPVMDGPTIQAAAQQALERRRPHPRRAAHRRGGRRHRHARRRDDLLEPRRALRRRPRFAADLAAAGGAGLITPDLTPDSGDGVDRRRRRARPRQDLPGRAVAPPTPGSR